MKYDIFISYKRLDMSRAVASKLYDFLSDLGYNVFLDNREMHSGDYEAQIFHNIDEAENILVLMEPESWRSWTNFAPHYQKPSGKAGDVIATNDGELTLNGPMIPMYIANESSVAKEAYDKDWYLREILYTLSLKNEDGSLAKNIVPVWLKGFSMDEETILPEEMLLLPKLQAVDFRDYNLIDLYLEYYFVDRCDLYLRLPEGNEPARPHSRKKRHMTGLFLIYTNAENCSIYERGKWKNNISCSVNNEDNPLEYPVELAGEHRFRCVNLDTCEEMRIKTSIEANSQSYIEVLWENKQCLWNLTEDQIASQTDSDELFRWGKGLFNGTSIHERNLMLATLCLKRSLSLGCGKVHDFVINCGSIDHFKREEGKLVWEMFAADLGNAEAQASMGMRHLVGNEVEENETKAAEWFRKAAEQGNVTALYFLGSLYKEGWGVEQNLKEAAEWYRKAAEQGDAHAMHSLGQMYEDGMGVEKSFEAALEWYRKAAEQGNATAQYHLGCMYEAGEGVEKSFEVALELYRRAAESGHADALLAIGWHYETGEGVEQNLKEAAMWYRKAAELGSANAQYIIGCMYEAGEGVEINPEEATMWYRKAAEQGKGHVLDWLYKSDEGGEPEETVATTMYILGRMFESGKAVDQNPEEAVVCYRKAAERGETSAMYSLGRMYESGEGVEINIEEAVSWYRRAADSGNHEAYVALARSLHMLGHYEEALDWVERAVSFDPDDPEVSYILTRIFQDHGIYDEATAQFELCLKQTDLTPPEAFIHVTHEKISALKALMESANK